MCWELCRILCGNREDLWEINGIAGEYRDLDQFRELWETGEKRILGENREFGVSVGIVRENG